MKTKQTEHLLNSLKHIKESMQQLEESLDVIYLEMYKIYTRQLIEDLDE